MKILFVQPVLPKYSISFFEKLTSVCLNKHEITIMADISTKHQLNQFTGNEGINVVNLTQKNTKGIVYRPKLRSLIKEGGYDLVVYNGNPRDISQFTSMLLDYLSKKKFAVWGMFHRIGQTRLVSETYYKLVGRMAWKSLTYSKKGYNCQLMRGISSHKLHELGTAIDEVSVDNYRKKLTGKQLQAFRVDNDLIGKEIVLQVVRLSEIKKPWLLIDAATELVKNNKNILIVLIGGGDLEKSLKLKVEKLNLTENVKFLGPIYDENILSCWFACSSVFVIPSCIGLSAHHAMCYSLPIVTDDDYESQASEFDIIQSGLNGLTYQHGSAASLAEVIQVVISNKELGQMIGSNAYYTVHNLFSLENKVQRFLKVVKGFENV